MAWALTVAAVIERQGRYLLVEETDGLHPERVLNQPAGHVDPGEGLLEAVIREVRGLGLLVGMELACEGDPIVQACLERGVLINCVQGNVLRFIPPLIVGTAEIDTLLECLTQVLPTV